MKSFLNKIFRSILGLSKPEDQPTTGPRNLPSPGGLTLISTTAAGNSTTVRTDDMHNSVGLTMISTTVGIDSPAAILEPVALKPTPPATAAGNITASLTDSTHNSVAGSFRPVDSAGDIRACNSTLTECVGIESCDLMVTQVPSVVPLTAQSRRRETMPRERDVLPPLMSSLNENGRRRFNLEKLRKDGRLQIYKNGRPEILRTVFPEEDRMEIRLIGSDQEEEEASDRDE